jgi:hypothetical protein
MNTLFASSNEQRLPASAPACALGMSPSAAAAAACHAAAPPAAREQVLADPTVHGSLPLLASITVAAATATAACRTQQRQPKRTLLEVCRYQCCTEATLGACTCCFACASGAACTLTCQQNKRTVSPCNRPMTAAWLYVTSGCTGPQPVATCSRGCRQRPAASQ